MERVPISFLEECFICDPQSGSLTWRERPAHHFKDERVRKIFISKSAGAKVGTIAAGGYLMVNFLYDGKKQSPFYVHRIIWRMAKGYWPKEIDHINGDKTDNRIANMREVSRQENSRNHPISSNNKSGITGVRFYKGKWVAEICVNGKMVYLGRHSNIDDAAKARKDAERKYGFHDNHGRM